MTPPTPASRLRGDDWTWQRAAIPPTQSALAAVTQQLPPRAIRDPQCFVVAALLRPLPWTDPPRSSQTAGSDHALQHGLPQRVGHAGPSLSSNT